VTATVVPSEVAAYLAAIRDALGDLGPEERDDLMAEVEASLIETAEEDDRPIAARLGPPDEFAAELRASAGLPPAGPAPPSPAPPSLVASLRAAFVGVAAHPRIQRLRRPLAELAPIWWLARAYVAVILLGALFGAHWSSSHPAVPRVGSGRFAALLLVAAVVGSIALGLRERHRRPARRSLVVLNVILALVAVPAGVHLLSVATSPSPIDVVPIAIASPSPPGLSNAGVPVRNIYAYSRDGRLLHDVLLYDGTGQPLDVVPGDKDPLRQVLTAPGGQPIFNSFPIRYFDPGTGRVTNPNAAPPPVGPNLFTPAAAPAPRRVIKARH
jgi:hypothetical protein